VYIRVPHLRSFVSRPHPFEQSIRDIHIGLAGFNKETEVLATKIQENFKEVGI